MTETNPDTTAILFVTYGEPTNRAFQPHYRYSLEILRRLTRTLVPLPSWILPIIAWLRANKKRRDWKRGRYVPALQAITRRVVDGVSDRLDGLPVHITDAYEFCEPSIETQIDAFLSEAITRFIIVPMYSADSTFTHTMTRRRAEGHAATRSEITQLDIISPWTDNDAARARLASLMANHVRDTIRSLNDIPERMTRIPLALVAHGAFLNPPAGIDNGLDKIQSLGDALIDALQNDFADVRIGYLNHARGNGWSRPDVTSLCRSFRRDGYRNVAIFPFGFLADNAESTLHSRDAARQGGFKDTIFIPCLNDYPAWLDYLAGTIRATVSPQG